MAVIIEYIKGFRENNFRALCLVSCEHPTHTGKIFRLIRKDGVDKGIGIKTCPKCCLKGKTHSQKWKDDMSEKMIGRKFSNEWKANISKSAIKRGISLDTRRKIAIAKKGKSVGELNPNWNPNLSQEDRVKRRNIVGYFEWGKLVKERDNYTCQISGQRGGDLESHHLNSYNWFKEGRLDVNNGITLAKDLHDLFHEIYGSGNNTKEQFTQFKDSILKGYC